MFRGRPGHYLLLGVVWAALCLVNLGKPSLWDIDDRRTSAFMSLFYKGLVAGLPKVEALAQAMRQLMKLNPHPYYWAPFVLVGADA